MTKYSPEFKLQIVNEYLEGVLGYRSLANKYAIPSQSQIETWVRQYKQEGKNGLQPKEKQEYTGEFKLNVLNYMKTTGASYSATADYFGISDIGTIANWKAKVLKDGVEALFRSKGRPRKNMIKLNSSKEAKVLTREQQLEEENKLLRIEIEYLKKCHAHGIAPWSQKIKSKQESSKS